jgi:hypothetical protein
VHGCRRVPVTGNLRRSRVVQTAQGLTYVQSIPAKAAVEPCIWAKPSDRIRTRPMQGGRRASLTEVPASMPPRVLALLSVLIAAGCSEATYGGCTDGITCRAVQASGLTFQCRFAGGGSVKPPVVMLHGFPEWSHMYIPLMRALAAQGFPSMACNQRGYSAGASPEDEAAYLYSHMVVSCRFCSVRSVHKLMPS